MTAIHRDAPPASPWLSVWLKPRDTIGRVLATDPRRHVLLLAALGAIGGLVAEVIEAGHATQLLDWRVAALVAGGGAIVGIVSLYVYGLFFRWSGRWLGGSASPVKVRAALAWGGAPTIIGLAIYLIALAWLMLSAGAGAAAPRTLMVAVQAVAVAVGVWSLVLTLLMLGRVQGFRLRANDRQRRAGFVDCRAGAGAPADHPDIRGPAVQHTERRHDADAARRRLSVRHQISLRLHALFFAVLAAAVRRTHPGVGTATGRRRGVPPAEGRHDRLHQAGGRPARRPHPDARRPAAHQRPAGQARAHRRLHRRGWRRVARGSSAGARPCRMA